MKAGDRVKIKADANCDKRLRGLNGVVLEVRDEGLRVVAELDKAVPGMEYPKGVEPNRIFVLDAIDLG